MRITGCLACRSTYCSDGLLASVLAVRSHACNCLSFSKKYTFKLFTIIEIVPWLQGNGHGAQTALHLKAHVYPLKAVAERRAASLTPPFHSQPDGPVRKTHVVHST